ncbi:MAG: UDP-N-acetylmuramoyl-L-alanyl-D-glutamate--2,6-diaminopimelate ligase [Eubacteriales bacterium]|nr:UDP-N-acetylmuramoyl-L-alanyl-D-glutamate--2,6-diaminopimelate ligase [Eubacteriales bacterium]
MNNVFYLNEKQLTSLADFNIQAYRFTRDSGLLESMDLREVPIGRLVYDSRKTQARDCFFALPGRLREGSKFIKDALKNGATTIVSEGSIEDLRSDLDDVNNDFQLITCQEIRKVMALMATFYYGEPCAKLHCIGITGTKGKSSLASLLSQILEAAGKKTLLIGTTGICFAGENHVSVNTTPESVIIQKAASAALAKGAEYLVLEVSSQALDMARTVGISFDLAVFHNISRDHIGPLEHPDFDSYVAAKELIFEQAKRALINHDMDLFGRVYENARKYLDCENIYTYSSEGDSTRADFCASEINFLEGGVSFKAFGEKLVLMPAANFLVSNAMAALACCELSGLDTAQAAKLLGSLQVPGRLEYFNGPNESSILIDYAHNRLSLNSLLRSLQSVRDKGRLILLIGTVGDRCEERRIEIPEVAEALADFTYLTSDNPGREPALKICQEMAGNFSTDYHNYKVIVDRKEAIKDAVSNLRKGDLLVLAGKGHEEYQLIGERKIPFSEREILKDLLDEH